jgi:hypothetical protein
MGKKSPVNYARGSLNEETPLRDRTMIADSSRQNQDDGDHTQAEQVAGSDVSTSLKTWRDARGISEPIDHGGVTGVFESPFASRRGALDGSP